MTPILTTRLLAEVPELRPTLAAWFEAEWPGWYGPGGRGDAAADVLAYSAATELPIGVVGFRDGEPVGFAALKADSITARPELGPWLGAALVKPECRGRGLGAQLFAAVAALARERGYPALYAGTATAASLFERCGWDFLEALDYHGDRVRLYRKALA